MADQLEAQFLVFCNFGVSGGGKTALTDKNLTKMFKDCKIYGKNLSTTDSDIAFSKIKEKGKKDISFESFKSLLHEIAPKYAKDHKIGSNEEAYKALVIAISAHGPSVAGTTGVSKTGAVDKMTDHTQYTGAHRARFDEGGKGRGKDGHEEEAEGSGYVNGYKGTGTYDTTH